MACRKEINCDRRQVVAEQKDRRNSSDVAPDGGYGWIVTAASFLCILISDGILYSFGLILSEAERLFDEPVAKVAWVFSIINGISYFSGMKNPHHLFCPIASALSNRFGFRAVILTGSVFGFLGLATSSLAQSIDSLFLTLGVFYGIAVCLVFTPIIVGMGLYFDKRRALATGVAVCGSGAGTFIFAPVVNWLLETYALRGTFLILSGIYLNCAILGSLMIPLKSHKRVELVTQHSVEMMITKPLIESHNQTKESCPIKQVENLMTYTSKLIFCFIERQNVERRNGMQLLKDSFLNALKLFKFSLFRSPTFVVICFSSFFQSFGWLVPFMYLAAHAVSMGISKEEASFLLSVVGICSMTGRIINGWLSDNPKVSVLLLNNIGLSISGLLIILCPFFFSYHLLVIFSIILGLATSCTAVTRPILLGELLGLENVNNAYGFMLVFYGIATLFGTPVAGFLYDSLGDYHGAFYLAGSSVLLSALICYPLGIINRWEKRLHSNN
ncbi:LOW QUALITY PROTEIN: monocarboxylate transporter 13-like [Daphnia carinata]|uniref:LOW QUALITY PROTEIN: monocarboxylate transporter 13-like n=1 Tax=Daphnia carinata TaxID=120202 RepID=UPI00286855BB|nr:LOW QUALITY PROTEIN: monocarboxylate transporter 13-like [Daphnia carinata]